MRKQSAKIWHKKRRMDNMYVFLQFIFAVITLNLVQSDCDAYPHLSWVWANGGLQSAGKQSVITRFQQELNQPVSSFGVLVCTMHQPVQPTITHNTPLCVDPQRASEKT